MDKLAGCALAFEKLLDIQYRMIVGRKEGNDVYIFLAKNKEADRYFCRSFFPKEQKDFTKGQAVYTLLYKEKICLSTGDIHIQYDRLTPKK